MRKLLLLALLLYDIVSSATRQNGYNDYDDMRGRMDDRRHPVGDEKRNWRRKALMKPELEQKDTWDDRRRHEYEGARYTYNDDDKNYVDRRINDRDVRDRERERDREGNMYKSRYEDEKVNMAPPEPKSVEAVHAQYQEKEPFRSKDDEKKPLPINCDRPHERYETCFAGCASVSCDNPRDRLRPCYPFCEPGCVCVGPYVRDDRTHKCVLPDDCTKGLKGIPDLGGASGDDV